jgi:hypothetical protein
VRSVEASVRACSSTVPPPRVSSVRVPPMRVVLVLVFVGLAAERAGQDCKHRFRFVMHQLLRAIEIFHPGL